MCNCCHSHNNSFDTQAVNCALKEAQVAANRACEAAKVAERAAQKAYNLAKAAEEAACQAENAADIAANAADCASAAVSKVECLINDYYNSAHDNCGCYQQTNNCNSCNC